MSQLIQRCGTPGFAGYSCAFSPFYPNKLAVATAANFGLVGNGRLHILQADPSTSLNIEKLFDSQDGLYDVAWSEIHENQLATASGDGSIKLWDIMLNEFPMQSWHEHKREVFCLDWNNLRKEIFASSSWDHLVKIWTPSRSDSIMTIPAHESCVYAARFSPSSPDTLATCSSDGSLKIWDTRNSPETRPPLVIPAHSNEVLSLDWNKYATHFIATASVDRTVKIHDIRKASAGSAHNSCVETLVGHQYAIRKVAWSPHAADKIATCGYDMTARVWIIPQISGQAPLPGAMGAISPSGIHNAHKEFVVGLAWSLYHPGLLATASWDQEVHLWSI
ncbi:peroxisomal targeting signal 2 receptor [Puccinia graminis f. sp. tritici]|uniref:Peroxin-7 n=1 Tax=Puccinia graminis f. sp. tritici TaxID=56615 RepID=A0A5B0R1M9_PUCGR|nr:peroxisomal targeting signal 2 receptor [Puccinia graminis f. sp. tritici]